MRSKTVFISGFLPLTLLVFLGCSRTDDSKSSLTTLMAPQLAEMFTKNAGEFDSRYGNQVVELVGLIRNRSEETPSTGKRYLVLWGYENPENHNETVVRCEYIPEFETVLPKGRIKVSGKVLPQQQSVQAVTLVDCKMIHFRKPYGEKTADSSNSNTNNMPLED